MKRFVRRQMTTVLLVLCTLLAGGADRSMAQWNVTLRSTGSLTSTAPDAQLTGTVLAHIPWTNALIQAPAVPVWPTWTPGVPAWSPPGEVVWEKWQQSVAATLTWNSTFLAPPARVYVLEHGLATANYWCFPLSPAATYTVADGFGDPVSITDVPYFNETAWASGDHPLNVWNPMQARVLQLPTRCMCGEVTQQAPWYSTISDGAWVKYWIDVVNFGVTATPAAGPWENLEPAQPDKLEISAPITIGVKDVNPDAEFPDQMFYQGEVTLSAAASLQGGQPLKPTPQFTWDTTGNLVAPDGPLASDAENQLCLATSPGATKEFHYDFGSDYQVVQAVPPTTVAKVTWTGAKDAADAPTGQVTIHWVWGPGSRIIRVDPDLDRNSPAYPAMQSIAQVQEAEHKAITTGATWVGNTLQVYIAIADYYATGPLYELGPAVLIEIASKAVEILKDARRLRALAKDSSRIADEYEGILAALKAVSDNPATSAADRDALKLTEGDLSDAYAASKERATAEEFAAGRAETIGLEATTDAKMQTSSALPTGTPLVRPGDPGYYPTVFADPPPDGGCVPLLVPVNQGHWLRGDKFKGNDFWVSDRADVTQEVDKAGVPGVPVRGGCADFGPFTIKSPGTGQPVKVWITPTGARKGAKGDFRAADILWAKAEGHVLADGTGDWKWAQDVRSDNKWSWEHTYLTDAQINEFKAGNIPQINLTLQPRCFNDHFTHVGSVGQINALNLPSLSYPPGT